METTTKKLKRVAIGIGMGAFGIVGFILLYLFAWPIKLILKWIDPSEE